MVEMQVRAEHVVDVLEAHAGGAETVEPGRVLEKPTTVDTPRTLSAYRPAWRSSTRVRSFPASLGLLEKLDRLVAGRADARGVNAVKGEAPK